MSKTLSRLVFTLGILSAPMMMAGCSEGEKGATTPPAAPTEGAPAATTPAPGEATPAPAPTTPAEPAPAK